MKRIIFFLLSVVFLCTGCENVFRDELNELHQEIDDMKARFEALSEEVNTNVEALRTIVEAVENNDYVKEIKPLYEDGKEVGYIITFVKGGNVTIYHGKDGQDGQDGASGKDGSTPEIGVRQDVDGIWYWTLDGEWLTDGEGGKVKAVGTDGKDGEDGADGSDGQDGQDGTIGITPQLKIEQDWWYISYDKGTTWTKLGKAKGEDGTDGEDGKDGTESIFADITWDDNCIYFILRDGSSITVNKNRELKIVFEETSGIVCAAGKTVSVQYTIQGGDSKTFVEAMGDNGWSAKVLQTNTESGEVRITAPTPMTDGKVLVFVNAGDGRTYVTSLTFTEGQIGVGNAVYYVGCLGGEINVDVRTSIDYYVSITDQPEWLSIQPATKSIRVDNLIFNAQENLYNEERSATINLIDDQGVTVETFRIIQKPNVTDDAVIRFKDKAVEAICLANFDLDKDGFLTKTEARQVTDIGTLFKSDKTITSFNEFQYFSSVTHIDSYAFSYSENLMEITLPQGIMTIGDGAFNSCAFVNITLPEGVTLIKDNTFQSCDNLLHIEIPDAVITIGQNAFWGCSSLKTIKMPAQLTYLKYQAFYRCSSLESIEIPDGVSVIEGKAFNECSSLSSVVLPSRLVTISNDAFAGCSSLESIDIPKSVSYIKQGAFLGCSSLKSVEIPAGVSILERSAFEGCSSLSEVLLPIGLVTISEGTFGGCSSLESIELPSMVSSIGMYAFRGCSSLKSIGIPAKVTEIPNSLLAGCSSLETVTLHNDILEIGLEVFKDCRSLTAIEIPSKVTRIYTGVFENCSSLKSVTLHDNITYIGDNVFGSCESLQSITLPESLLEIGSGIFQNCKSLTEITIPDLLRELPHDAFSGCSALSKVIMHDNIFKLGTGIFRECLALEEVTLPQNITVLPDEIFQGCLNLRSITIPEKVTSVGRSVVKNCMSLTEIICKPVTPPTLSSSFDLVNPMPVFKVPSASLEQYKTASGWSAFAAYITASQTGN